MPRQYTTHILGTREIKGFGRIKREFTPFLHLQRKTYHCEENRLDSLFIWGCPNDNPIIVVLLVEFRLKYSKIITYKLVKMYKIST